MKIEASRKFSEKYFVAFAKDIIKRCCKLFDYKSRPILKLKKWKNEIATFCAGHHKGRFYIFYNYNNFVELHKNKGTEWLSVWLIFSIAHEMRHYYQFRQLTSRNPVETHETLTVWGEEYSQNIDLEQKIDLEQLNKQAIELDANLFGLVVTAQNYDFLISLKHISDDYIDLLEKRFIEIFGYSDERIFDRSLFK